MKPAAGKRVISPTSTLSVKLVEIHPAKGDIPGEQPGNPDHFIQLLGARRILIRCGQLLGKGLALPIQVVEELGVIGKSGQNPRRYIPVRR